MRKQIFKQDSSGYFSAPYAEKTKFIVDPNIRNTNAELDADIIFDDGAKTKIDYITYGRNKHCYYFRINDPYMKDTLHRRIFKNSTCDVVKSIIDGYANSIYTTDKWDSSDLLGTIDYMEMFPDMPSIPVVLLDKRLAKHSRKIILKKAKDIEFGYTIKFQEIYSESKIPTAFSQINYCNHLPVFYKTFEDVSKSITDIINKSKIQATNIKYELILGKNSYPPLDYFNMECERSGLSKLQQLVVSYEFAKLIGENEKPPKDYRLEIIQAIHQKH